tara:strand:- start:690 stop:1880 length:1191 start_codon:yes stop_codon:yes gene_type:complete
MKESILFLGVGHLQRYSINSAKASGFTVFGVDINLNAGSATACDHFLNIDSTDVAAIYDWCRSIEGFEVVAVWANNDILIPARASLESALDLKVPHASHQVCFDLLSKVRSSKILSDTGFMPQQYDLNNNTVNELDFPVIVKPKKGSGSQGVRLIKSQIEFEEVSFSSEKEVIEEYIEGIEFGTNHFYDGENVFKLPAVRRYFDHSITMVPLGTVMADMRDSSLKNAYSCIEELIVNNKWKGPLKADIFIGNDQFYIIEMSPRFHGEIDTSFVFDYTGLSLPDMYFSRLANLKKHPWSHSSAQLENSVCGYISICNDTVVGKDEFLVNTIAKYDLNYLSFVHSGTTTSKKTNKYPESTGDLIGFVFYSSEEKLSSDDFKQLFKDINLLEIVTSHYD